MILVPGATGAIGRPLVDLLHAAGGAVRASTRAPRGAARPAGAEAVDERWRLPPLLAMRRPLEPVPTRAPRGRGVLSCVRAQKRVLLHLDADARMPLRPAVTGRHGAAAGAPRSAGSRQRG
jgi:nucleoside-diphosphate-sugar epimerase